MATHERFDWKAWEARRAARRMAQAPPAPVTMAQLEEKQMANAGRLAHLREQQARLIREYGPQIAAQEVDALIASARQADPTVTIEAATAAAYDARPDLYATIQGYVAADVPPAPPELETLITAARRDDPTLTYELAYDAVLQAHPGIYDAAITR